MDKRTDVKYALKIIDAKKMKGKEEMLENEIQIQRNSIHPNLVQVRVFEAYLSAIIFPRKNHQSGMGEGLSFIKTCYLFIIIHHMSTRGDSAVSSLPGESTHGFRDSIRHYCERFDIDPLYPVCTSQTWIQTVSPHYVTSLELATICVLNASTPTRCYTISTVKCSRVM